MQFFFIVCLYLYCLWRSNYQREKVWIPLTGLTPPPFCATSYVVVFFFFLSNYWRWEVVLLTFVELLTITVYLYLPFVTGQNRLIFQHNQGETLIIFEVYICVDVLWFGVIIFSGKMVGMFALSAVWKITDSINIRFEATTIKLQFLHQC